jgi:hypothetical protein
MSVESLDPSMQQMVVSTGSVDTGTGAADLIRVWRSRRGCAS